MTVADMLGQRGALDARDLTWPDDIGGWTPPNLQGVVRRLCDERDLPGHVVVVEVGVWKGRSTVAIVAGVEDSGRTVELVAVDTWLGSPEFWLPGAGETRDLRRRRGYPTVYEVFADNMVRRGLQDRVTPLPLPSLQAAVVLEHLGVRPHIVYVDGAHEYDAVLADCDAWWSQVADGGVLLGDDYAPDWPDVVEAVDEFDGRWDGSAVEHRGRLWIARKPPG